MIWLLIPGTVAVAILTILLAHCEWKANHQPPSDETLLLDALDNYDIAYNRARDGRWDQADRYRDEARRLRALREIEKAR